jgi:hypothetical protein
VGGGADGRAPLVIQQTKMKKGEGEFGLQAGRWAAGLKEKAIGLLELCGLREGGGPLCGFGPGWGAVGRKEGRGVLGRGRIWS